MEDQFNFQIDFETMSTTIPMAETPRNEGPQQTNLYTETMQEGKKVYICAVAGCNKAFKFLSQANRHSITHKEDRPHQCTFPGCNKTFKRADVLENHMQAHKSTENLPFACDELGCDRKFASKSALNYHQAKHENNRIFKCDVEGCGKSFLLAPQLKQHKKMHYDDPLSEDEFNPDPALQKEYERLCAYPCKPERWQMVTQKVRQQLSDEGLLETLRNMFNYLIIQNRVLKEKSLKDSEDEKKSSQAKDNSSICSSASNLGADLTRLTEHFDSEELKLLEFLKEKGNNDF